MTRVAEIVADAATTLLVRVLRQEFSSPQLSEIITINNGQGLKAENRDSTGDFDVYGSGGLVGNHSEGIHQGPFVVIGRKGSAGKITFAPRGGWVTDTAYFATPIRPRELQCKFLFYALKSLDFRADIIATAIPGINRTAIYGYSIPLPPPELQTSVVEFLDAIASGRTGNALPQLPSPLAEQRRAVARLEELAAQIDEACTLRHQVSEEVEALFEASVGKRFLELSNLPTRTLETLTTKIGSGSTPMGGRAAYPTSGIPFVRSMNVRMRRFQWDDIAFISSDTHQRMCGTTVHPRDVLLNITGASIGRVACAPNDIAEANVNQHVAIIRPTEELEARYLMYWLSQPAIQEFINDEQKGATRQGFTKAQIQAFEIPMAPLPEQRRIVAELDALQVEVDALKRLQAETAAELDALLPSILDKAFKGEL